ncbi:MAG: serine hydrolase [Cytophagia bacterium]|nr:serine hydrolase [Cytophagia bacterium]
MKSKLYIFLMLLVIGCTNTKSSYLNLDRLKKIDDIISEDIKENKIPGAVVLVGNEDEIIFEKAYGIKNPETNEKYNTNDIFRIASMTKAITSVGVLKLWEEGKIGLDDPINKYIPKFENIEILESFNNEDTSYTSKISTKKITIRQLLTHTSGIGYGFIDGNKSIKSIYHKRKQSFMKNGVLCFCDEDITIGETIENLADVPLHHEPGERFTYGIGLDVLGYMIEIVSGKKLDEFFRDEIFTPLDMNDTYFYLPKEKENRLVPVLTKKDDEWVIFEDGRFNVNYPIEGKRKFFAGGCGLSSTVRDYYKFLTVFLNDGKFKGKSFISKQTNDLIFQNQLPESFGFGVGLAFGIVLEKDLKNGGTGSEGTISWGGYWNTSFFADPEDKYIGLIYKQTQNIQDDSSDLFRRAVSTSVVK